MVPINYLAVVASTVVFMILGSLWYSSLLFGKPWMKGMGLDQNDAKKMEEMKKSAGPAMGGMLVSAFIMSYVLAHWVYYTQSNTVVMGLQAGFWPWLGFVATTLLSGSLFEGRKWVLYWISGAYYLVALLLGGIILALWK